MKITRRHLRKIIEETARRSLDDPRGNLDRTRDITVSKHGGPRPAGHPFYDYNPRDYPEKYDAEEVEAFPNTAASKDELLHADIVSAVYDAVSEEAKDSSGDDLKDIVLIGIDEEMERREAEGNEVDFSQIDLQKVVQDVMIDLAKVRRQAMSEKLSLTGAELKRFILREISIILQEAEARPGPLGIAVDTEPPSIYEEDDSGKQGALDAEMIATVSDENKAGQGDATSPAASAEINIDHEENAMMTHQSEEDADVSG